MQYGVSTSLTTIDHPYCSSATSTQQLSTHIRSRIEYLIPSHNIIVICAIVWHFNLTIKNLISLAGFYTI